MTSYETVDEEKLKNAPLRTFLLINLQQTDDNLLNAAMIGISSAFGNHPEMLNEDQDYYKFINDYVNDVLIPYTIKAAATQLALLTLGGNGSMKSAHKSFITEAKKVQDVILPDKELGDVVLLEENRSWHFFISVISIIALLSHENKRIAKLFGIKKSLFCSWKQN